MTKFVDVSKHICLTRSLSLSVSLSLSLDYDYYYYYDWRAKEGKARLVERCPTSTETVRLIRDGEPRTSTSTFTPQLLSSEGEVRRSTPVCAFAG